MGNTIQRCRESISAGRGIKRVREDDSAEDQQATPASDIEPAQAPETSQEEKAADKAPSRHQPALDEETGAGNNTAGEEVAEDEVDLVIEESSLEEEELEEEELEEELDVRGEVLDASPSTEGWQAEAAAADGATPSDGRDGAAGAHAPADAAAAVTEEAAPPSRGLDGSEAAAAPSLEVLPPAAPCVAAALEAAQIPLRAWLEASHNKRQRMRVEETPQAPPI